MLTVYTAAHALVCQGPWLVAALALPCWLEYSTCYWPHAFPLAALPGNLPAG